MSLLSVLAASLSFFQLPSTVAEFHDGVVVNCGSTQRKIEVNARVSGILGWSFDLSRSGRLVTVEPVRPPTKPAHARLVLRESLSSPGTNLISDEAGFSSPLFSPDEKEILVVRGIHDLWVVDVSSGTTRQVGSGIAGVWDSKGNIYAYERLPSGCHRLRALSGVLPDSTLCKGESALSVINGAPTRVDLPVVDEGGNVVGWLGADKVQSASRLKLAGDQLGYGCDAGLDYQTHEGGWVTMSAKNPSVPLPGRSCENAAMVKSAIKALSCSSKLP